MARVFKPEWTDLEAVIAAAGNRLLLCSPFINKEGVGRSFDAIVRLGTTVEVHVLTRLSPTDWQLGVSDPEELLVLLETLEEAGYAVGLRICPRLHAKIYVADDAVAIVGSANLTAGGFDRNVELMVELDAADVPSAVATVRGDCDRAGSYEVKLDKLRDWVEKYRDSVKDTRKLTNEIEEELADAQRDLNVTVLNRGSKVAPVASLQQLVAFIGWLRKHPELPGSTVIVARYDNADGSNLQGHVKQTFFGSEAFLRLEPSAVSVAGAALDGLGPVDVPELPSDLVDQWSEFLESHSGQRGDVFDFGVLGNILPPSVGGTRSGGGGAIGTLKRVLPLVAKYIEEAD